MTPLPLTDHLIAYRRQQKCFLSTNSSSFGVNYEMIVYCIMITINNNPVHPKTLLINYLLLEPLYPVYCDIRLRLMNVALGGCFGPQDIFLPLMYLLIIN